MQVTGQQFSAFLAMIAASIIISTVAVAAIQSAAIAHNIEDKTR